MQVTVAVPTYRTPPDMLRRSIRSILDQTHRDLRLIIVCDGDRPRILTRDSRVDVIRLPVNRGTYFARAVALAATDTDWHAVIDADDWVEPDWLELLLAQDADATWSHSRIDHHGDQHTVREWKQAGHSLGPLLAHTVSHTGLYDTHALRDVGGYHPGYRIGYDTMVVALMKATSDWTLIDQPRYHRTVRGDSLTQHPDTHTRSTTRQRNRQKLRHLYRQAWSHRNNPERVRDLIEATVPDELAEQVAEHAATLTPKVAA